MRKFTSGERLKQIMNERNLKQVDILNMTKPYQKKLGIKLSKSHLSNYVNDKSSPHQNSIYLLSKTLDVSEGWLMGYDVDRERIPDSERGKEVDPQLTVAGGPADPIADFAASLVLDPKPKMAELILLEPSDDEVDSLVAFLKTTRSLNK